MRIKLPSLDAGRDDEPLACIVLLLPRFIAQVPSVLNVIEYSVSVYEERVAPIDPMYDGTDDSGGKKSSKSAKK